MYLVRSVSNRVLERTSSTRTLVRSSSSRVLQRVIGNLTVTVNSGGSAPQTGSGSPLNTVTPDFAGQLYKDNTTGQVYVSFTTSSADWFELVRNY